MSSSQLLHRLHGSALRPAFVLIVWERPKPGLPAREHVERRHWLGLDRRDDLLKLGDQLAHLTGAKVVRRGPGLLAAQLQRRAFRARLVQADHRRAIDHVLARPALHLDAVFKIQLIHFFDSLRAEYPRPRPEMSRRARWHSRSGLDN